MFDRGRLAAGEWLLVQGGTSGIGVTAIQLAKAFGAKVIATAGSRRKCAALIEFGADQAINYRTEDFAAGPARSPAARASTWCWTWSAATTSRASILLAEEGRIVLIAMQGGTKTQSTPAPCSQAAHPDRLDIAPATRGLQGRVRRVARAKVWPLLAARRLSAGDREGLPRGAGRPGARGDGRGSSRGQADAGLGLIFGSPPFQRTTHGTTHAQETRRRQLEDARLASAGRRGAARRASSAARPFGCDVAVCVPFPYLGEAAVALAGSDVRWGAQDCSAHAQGAYTGEVSAAMLAEFGCRYVIVGHSERRAMHGETDALVADKAKAALARGLTPIVCVGETLGAARAGHARRRSSSASCRPSIHALGHCVGEMVVAYEPVWAIGTGVHGHARAGAGDARADPRAAARGHRRTPTR